MSINLIDKIKHANGKDPVVDAADVAMADGTRLDQAVKSTQTLASATAQRVVELGIKLDDAVAPLVRHGAAVLEPEAYYDFGAVDSLEVALSVKNDGKAHEYTFEFTPTADFQGLTITPEPQWIGTPQYPAGRRCIVSIVRGMAVMGNA